MNRRHLQAALLVIASLISLNTFAQNEPSGVSGSSAAPPGMGMGPGRANRGMHDCSVAADPQLCAAHKEARKQAFAACKDKVGVERRQCMHDQMRNVDCGKMPDPARCEAHKKAMEECKGKAGPEFHQCMSGKLPPPDCSKAPNPERCQQMQKAREACKDKAPGELRQCMRDQFKSAK